MMMHVFCLAEAFLDRQTKGGKVGATTNAEAEGRSRHGATLSQSVCECSLTLMLSLLYWLAFALLVRGNKFRILFFSKCARTYDG